MVIKSNLFVEYLIIKAVKIIRSQEDVQCFQVVLQKLPVANLILIREISDFLVEYIQPKSNYDYKLMDRKGNYNDNSEIKRLNLLSQVEDLVKFPKNSSSEQEKLFQEILKKSRKTILLKLCLKHTPKLNEFEIEDLNATSN